MMTMMMTTISPHPTSRFGRDFVRVLRAAVLGAKIIGHKINISHIFVLIHVDILSEILVSLFTIT